MANNPSSSDICVRQGFHQANAFSSCVLDQSSLLHSMTSSLAGMPPNEAEAEMHPARQDFPPQANYSGLKRSPAPLSVRLRSKPSKRLKGLPKIEDEAELQPLTTHSHPGTPPVLLRKKNLLTVKPNWSDSVRRAKAEEWFNDNNKNVFRAQNAVFPDGRSCSSVTVSNAVLKSLRRSTLLPPSATVVGY